MNKSGNMIQIDTTIVGKFHFHKYYWFSKILENSPNKSLGPSNSYQLQLFDDIAISFIRCKTWGY